MTIYLGIDNVCYTQTMRSGQMDLASFLDNAVGCGAAAVQMDPLMPTYGFDLSDASLDKLRGLLTARGLQIVVKGNSGGRGSLSNHPDASGDDLELFRLKLEAAAKLGSPALRVVTRAYPYPTAHTTPPKGVPRDQVVGWVIDNLKTLTRYAEELRVCVVIENHGDLRIAELERILQEVNSPFLGVQYDLLEQVAIFEDPRLAAERLLPFALTVHWNDAYPRLSSTGFQVVACPPGEGIIDLDGVTRMIASQPRDIYIFTAFQAGDIDVEDQLVRAYLQDLRVRFGQSA